MCHEHQRTAVFVQCISSWQLCLVQCISCATCGSKVPYFWCNHSALSAAKEQHKQSHTVGAVNDQMELHTDCCVRQILHHKQPCMALLLLKTHGEQNALILCIKWQPSTGGCNQLDLQWQLALWFTMHNAAQDWQVDPSFAFQVHAFGGTAGVLFYSLMASKNYVYELYGESCFAVHNHCND